MLPSGVKGLLDDKSAHTTGSQKEPSKLCTSTAGQLCRVANPVKTKCDGHVGLAVCCGLKKDLKVKFKGIGGFMPMPYSMAKTPLCESVNKVVCFHVPGETVEDPANKQCRLQLNYRQAPGTAVTTRWAVESGQHNTPAGKWQYLDNMVLAGRGCMAVLYSSPNATGHQLAIGEGFHIRPQHKVESVLVIAPVGSLCKGGEGVQSDGTCAPCAEGQVSRPGTGQCETPKVCSNVKCVSVRPGHQHKVCPGSKYWKWRKTGSHSYSTAHRDEEKCTLVTAHAPIMHVFHHGKEKEGGFHKCHANKITGRCKCVCYSNTMTEYVSATAGS
jgi:hypothetical protein